MSSYFVEGGHRLSGKVAIGGSKNASLAVLSAAMVLDGPCIVDNLPQIRDMETLLRFLEIGATGGTPWSRSCST